MRFDLNADSPISHSCLCGCRISVATNRKFAPGDDQKLRIAIEDAVGDLEALRKLVRALARFSLKYTLRVCREITHVQIGPTRRHE